jgi:hypothetical protein
MPDQLRENGKLIGIASDTPGRGDLIAVGMHNGASTLCVWDDALFILEPPCFSLVCSECDCDGADTVEAAELEGWTGIWFTPDRLSHNYEGVCPECAAEIAREGGVG